MFNKMILILAILLLVACGTTWQMKTLSGQTYLLEEVEYKEGTHAHKSILLMENNSELRLTMEGVKRIVLDHDRIKKYDGRSWVAIRVDFEEGPSWNAPDSTSAVSASKDSTSIKPAPTDSASTAVAQAPSLVGPKDLYVLRGSWMQGLHQGQPGKWPVADILEVTMEEEAFLTNDSTEAKD